MLNNSEAHETHSINPEDWASGRRGAFTWCGGTGANWDIA